MKHFAACPASNGSSDCVIRESFHVKQAEQRNSDDEGSDMTIRRDEAKKSTERPFMFGGAADQPTLLFRKVPLEIRDRA